MFSENLKITFLENSGRIGQIFFFYYLWWCLWLCVWRSEGKGQRTTCRSKFFSLSTMRVLGSKSDFQVSCFTYWVVLPAQRDRLFPSSLRRLVLCAQWAPEVRTSVAWLSSPQFRPDIGFNGPYVSGPCEVWATALLSWLRACFLPPESSWFLGSWRTGAGADG